MITRRIKASPTKVTGIAPAGQRFESFLEEEFFVLMRYRSDIASFERPKAPIRWKDGTGKIRSYTPDLIVEYKPTAGDEVGRTIVCEIKPNFEKDRGSPVSLLPRHENEEENELKWAAATDWAEARRWSFKVFRSDEIRSPYLQNAKFLVKYVERAHSKDGEVELLSTLKASGPVSLIELVERVAADRDQRAKLFPTLYTLIVTGKIDVDLTVQLNSKSILSIPDAA